MAITYKTGNITTSTAQAMLVEINTSGVLATMQEFNVKIFETENFRSYDKLRLDNLLFYKQCYVNTGKFTYFNLVVYPSFWQPTNLTHLAESLDNLVTAMGGLAITSLAVPQVGMMKAPFDWEIDVKPIVLEKLTIEGLDLEIYE